MRIWTLLISSCVLASSSVIHAEPANLWRVNGAISGRAVVLDCRLEQGTGNCVGAAPGSKAYPLASLSASGNQMNWSFKLHYSFIRITLAFTGHVTDDRMSGTMTAAGRSGTFTAARR